MPEASSRLLVDRSIIRVDGLPFFTFGPRLLLTPPGHYRDACREIAAAGFTCVGSPPASPATLPMLESLFEAAQEHGLFVVLLGDRRLPRHGRYLADRFRWRPNLHSYGLPWYDDLADMEERFTSERDEIRARDLFHPIWANIGARRSNSFWLRSMDLYAAGQEPWHASMKPGPTAANRLAEVARLSRPPSVPRPLFCASLPVLSSDSDRLAGLYDHDPNVRILPREYENWFPGFTAFDSEAREDWLAPEPSQLRLRTYELLMQGVRGVLLDFWEAMRGTPPHTGRDRLAEATILAQEIAVLRDFFAEGTPELCMLESGHPKLAAAVLRHGEDHLVLLRAIDDSPTHSPGENLFLRVEVDIRPTAPRAWTGWRMDFPSAHPIAHVEDAQRALRLSVGTVDTTALVLLTPGRQRAEALARGLAERLPLAARAAVDCLRHLLAKTGWVEERLHELRAGVPPGTWLEAARKASEAAQGELAAGNHERAYTDARAGTRALRELMRVQEARARGDLLANNSMRRDHLARCYFTIPEFFREGRHDSDSVVLEFT
ncbi:MAG: hypothetical protein SF028_02060 [Candidatus Sumerlaeia bacterium]|nr:hypothetical protein [Candidatus Sumerlaeia bacterium]